jgi:hypothetical protein
MSNWPSKKITKIDADWIREVQEFDRNNEIVNSPFRRVGVDARRAKYLGISRGQNGSAWGAWSHNDLKETIQWVRTHQSHIKETAKNGVVHKIFERQADDSFKVIFVSVTVVRSQSHMVTDLLLPNSSN